MKILLVEDNQINREVARSFLEGDNHVVVEAHDGKEGVKLASWDEFDVILMDISMPEMDGIEATQLIRAGKGRSRNVPIVALTAHTQKEDIDKFLAAGMNEVAFKPITRQAMRDILSTLNAGTATSRGGSKNVAATEPDRINNAILSQFKRDIGEEKFPILLNKFIAEMDVEIERLCLPETYNDPETLEALAHRLSGSAALFGVAALLHTLKEIETSATTHPPPDLNDLCARARQTWNDTRSDLQPPA